jgi:TrmH family RNA methyltransferase
MKQITSPHNDLVKHIITLKEKSRARKKSGEFVVEGLRELQIALASDYEVVSVLFYEELFPFENLRDINVEDYKCIEISKEIYTKIAYRSTTEGILAVLKTKEHTLENLRFNTENPLILVAEAPEKPGNIGALLRTADAANVDAVIIANPKTDLYNPNIVRSSVGCVFSNTIATGSTEDVIDFLNTHNISIYSAILQESINYTTPDYKTASAIVVGTEATGLTQEWRDASLKNISIPMEGKIDSMNVSVAAGILIFEALRQRGF